MNPIVMLMRVVPHQMAGVANWRMQSSVPRVGWEGARVLQKGEASVRDEADGKEWARGEWKGMVKPRERKEHDWETEKKENEEGKGKGV